MGSGVANSNMLDDTGNTGMPGGPTARILDSNRIAVNSTNNNILLSQPGTNQNSILGGVGSIVGANPANNVSLGGSNAVAAAPSSNEASQLDADGGMQ